MIVSDPRPWEVLVADDEEGIHTVTKLVLKRKLWRGRAFNVTSAYSAAEAREKLEARNGQFHVAIVDVVMETDRAGLDLCHYIRSAFSPSLRIILRTGQAGKAPEEQVLESYDIDHYLSKVDATEQRIFGLLRACLRASQDVTTALAVPLPDEKTLPKSISATLRQLPAINVFRMLANVPTSFHPFLKLGESLLDRGKLSGREREIVILRQAHVSASPYEWHQHVLIARAYGITEEEILHLRSDGPVTGLSERENFLCRVSDEITKDSALDDDTFKKLYAMYPIELATELILCVSYYNMAARFLNCTRVQIEDDNPLEGLSTPLGIPMRAG